MEETLPNGLVVKLDRENDTVTLEDSNNVLPTLIFQFNPDFPQDARAFYGALCMVKEVHVVSLNRPERIAQCQTTENI